MKERFKSSELKLVNYQAYPYAVISEYKIGMTCFLNSGSPCLIISKVDYDKGVILVNGIDDAFPYKCLTISKYAGVNYYLPTQNVISLN